MPDAGCRRPPACHPVSATGRPWLGTLRGASSRPMTAPTARPPRWPVQLMPWTVKVITRFSSSRMPTCDRIARACGPSSRWRRRETTNARPNRPKMAPEAPAAAERGSASRMVSTLPPSAAQEVHDRVLHVAVELLEDRPEQVERVHVEGDVQHAEVQEHAGEEPPPLAVGDLRGGDPAGLHQLPVAAPQAQAPEAVGGGIGEEDQHVDGDERQRHEAPEVPYTPRARLNWRRAAKSWPVSLSSQAIRLAIAPRSAAGARRSASR